MELLIKISLVSMLIIVDSCVFSEPKITPSANVSNVPNIIKSVEPSSKPTNGVADTGQITNLYIIHGFIYDQNKNKISNANVKIRILNSKLKQDMSDKNILSDVDGMYIFRNVIDKSEIEISVSKNGYKTSTRTYNLDSDKYLTSPQLLGNVNFGGNDEESKYALEKI